MQEAIFHHRFRDSGYVLFSTERKTMQTEDVEQDHDSREQAAREAIEGMRSINQTVKAAAAALGALMLFCTIAILLAIDPQHIIGIAYVIVGLAVGGVFVLMWMFFVVGRSS
jgi:hypothetical protein